MKRLPVGIENFEEMIEGDYYYVDKTPLIKFLWEDGSKVTLFTRPRRFGKTLNISMLKYFFEVGRNPQLFDGLKISKDREFCKKYQNQYPVISLSLKDVDGLDFIEAVLAFCRVIYNEAERFSFLLSSDRLSDIEKEQYKSILNLGLPEKEVNKNLLETICSSLYKLSALLNKHYHKKVVILIDEYDVPLDKAHVHGYYDEMVNLIRKTFHSSFKTNDNLAFGVLTGCLRISKESIFTGMNNFSMNSITMENTNEFFGFNEQEVDGILSDHGLAENKLEVKDWYDGYKFGNSEIYCPWDVINYVQKFSSGQIDHAISFWADSSSNDLVRQFVNIASEQISEELDSLINGMHIKKKIREEITYRDIDNNIDNLWSILYLTGYLTGFRVGEDIYELWIPNREVQKIYEDDIMEWFTHFVSQDHEAGKRFYNAALSEKPEEMQTVLCDLLFDSISIRDTYARKGLRENFYHGFMLGLLTGFSGIMSNSESGDGYSDIQIRDKKNRTVAIMELKYSESDTEKSMQSSCDSALAQIEKKKYSEMFTKNNVFTKVIKYGIAFNKKSAIVKMG